MKFFFLRLYNLSGQVIKESFKSISELFDQWPILISLIITLLQSAFLELQALLQTYQPVCMPPSREGRKVTFDSIHSHFCDHFRYYLHLSMYSKNSVCLPKKKNLSLALYEMNAI
jgi:hypothetical protein